MSLAISADRFKRRLALWAVRRQGRDPIPVTLHRRRVYILPTPQGLLYALSVLAMLLAALNYNNNLGLLLAFLLAGLGIAAMYRCQRNLAGLVVHVQQPPAAFVGETLFFPLLLHHRGRQSRFAISGTGESIDVPPGQSATTRVRQPARRRGRQALKRFSLNTTFPLGLFRAWVWIDSDIGAIVFPRPADEPAPDSLAAGGPGDTGSGRDGDDDFAGLRAWRDGDSLHHVDWRALARGRDLLTKQFSADPPALHCYDLAALGGLPLEQALSRLARSVVDADAGGERYALKLGTQTLGPDAGPAHRERCLVALALFAPEEPTGG